MTLYELYAETTYRPISLVHCTRCGGEYGPQEMIFLDNGQLICPLEACKGVYQTSIFPVVVTED